jgi:outer membrane protein assembly factor BamD (BamD/ComL family)
MQIRTAVIIHALIFHLGFFCCASAQSNNGRENEIFSLMQELYREGKYEEAKKGYESVLSERYRDEALRPLKIIK